MTPRRTSLAGRVLALLSDYDAELRAEDIARHLWPPPRMTAPPVGSWDSRRAAFAAMEAAKVAHRDATTARASKAIRRLQGLGYVEDCGAPSLAGWYVEVEAARGPALAMAFAVLGSAVKVKPAHRALVAELRVGRGVPHVREWLGVGRQRREAYRDLTGIGVIVMPTQRRLTDAGRAVVEGWRAAG